MIPRFARWLRRFTNRDDGYVTIEVMILLPPLLVMMAASWVLFDVFRQQTINQKANYTIGDMLSRETQVINAQYITGSRNLFRELIKTQSSDARIRITVVSFDADNDQYSVEWSQQRGGVGRLSNSALRSDYPDRLPIMADEEQIILVETWEPYSPVFRIGIDPFDITTYSFTRPRYAPQLLYES